MDFLGWLEVCIASAGVPNAVASDYTKPAALKTG